jgi:hypothetical protein
MSTGVCNLGSLNLVKFVKNGVFDLELFKYVIEIAVRFLDNINDVLWLCEVCDKTQVSKDQDGFENDSRIVKLDISQSSERLDFDDCDVFEFRNVCADCRRKISNGIYDLLLEINPNIHENRP